ncbi:MAG TPA: protein kinase [Pyrinomonadaceae bacterium]|nr:protein kinase [Pyrinomonadaceae bacterium]
MSLSSGTKLGRYEIRSKIGEGGMGEVYRAYDGAMHREVAIKILPAALSADKGRLARFEQEAQTAGSLNHPNILVIHHIETHEGAPYIVSELLEGETLRERMGGVALSQRKAIDYGLQIAHGLAAAHEKGIVHRDLKPENVFITKDGRVKILDFGLAKLTGASDGSQSQTEIPTRRVDTDPGVVMGTIGYMSPEQVRGKSADHRSDIFSFGAILYEMLSGRRAFRGESTADTISAILREDPPDLSSTNRDINPALERVVNHCLEKSPEERFNSARDLAFALEALSGPATTSESTTTVLSALPTSKRKRREVIPWALAGVLLIACASLALLYFWPRSVDKRPISFAIEVPDKVTEIREPAVSPDGRMIAFQGISEGKPALYLRALDSINAQRIAGTDNGALAFWSPDSRSIGFFSDNKLKKVDLTGGAPQTLCNAATGVGGTWNREGTILFAIAGHGLQRVSASGGEPAQALALDSSRLEIEHDYPVFLPDGKHFLYYSWKGTRGASEIYVSSLQNDQRKLLLKNDSNIAYVVPGYLLFAREFTLMAQAFDASKLELSGEPFPVLENVAYSSNNSLSHFSVSENGTIVFWKGSDVGRQLAWFDRSGKQIATVGPPGTYNDIMLSPDEKHAAMQKIDGGNSDIWIMDLVRGAPLRFTFSAASDDNPSWSPDGNLLIHTSTSEGKTTFFRKNSNGSGNEERLYETTSGIDDGTDWSGDGKNLLFETIGEKTLSDVWVLPLDGTSNAHPLLQSEFSEFHPRCSPDGRWIAYASSESGRTEIYIQSFPPAGGKWQVSTTGGAQPRWRRDGKELYFMTPERTLMAVDVKLGATFEMGTPKPLFQTSVSSFESPNRYDVSADGQRFLVNSSINETSRTPIVVIVNWAAGLKKQ